MGRATDGRKSQDWRTQEGGVTTINRDRVGIVMAGNIPLVGLHDFLSVFLSGHFAIVKMSSDDQYILPVLVKVLLRHDELFEGDWVFVDQLSDMGAVIATGVIILQDILNTILENTPILFAKTEHLLQY